MPKRATFAAIWVAALALAMPTTVWAATTADSTELTVTDAVWRWGVNNESNNRAPSGAYNFFSAGRVPDPGRSRELTESKWHQADGAVAIEKLVTSGDTSSYVPATWAGLRTQSDGTPLGSFSAGTFSNHQFVFSNGTGTADPATGDLHIAWTGDVTIAFYGGLSFFYLSDPVLTVTDGTGEITATLTGFATDREDGGWAPVPPARVTVATLRAVTREGDCGFTATPAYPDSFPASWVAYHQPMGTAPFWQKTGGATDAFKVPLPLSVTCRGATAPTPTPTPSTPLPSVSNPVLTPRPSAPAPAAPRAVVLEPISSATPPVALPVLGTPGTGDTVVAASVSPDPGPSNRWWFAGSLLLLLAALLLSLPPSVLIRARH